MRHVNSDKGMLHVRVVPLGKAGSFFNVTFYTWLSPRLADGSGAVESGQKPAAPTGRL